MITRPQEDLSSGKTSGSGRFTTHETGMSGVVFGQIHGFQDDRGSFRRAYCREDLAELGLPTEYAQSNLSYNDRAGTLRGLHWQEAPHEEGKLVQIVRGRIFDAVVDLRRDSPTFGEQRGFILDENEPSFVYLPEGTAHGYQSLTDDSIVLYHVTAPYAPGAARTIHWDSPELGIQWPLPPTALSDADRDAPRWSEWLGSS